MAKNTLRDLDTTAANNTDILNQSTAGTASAATIDTLIQNTLGVIARGYGDIGGRGTVGGTGNAITLTSLSTYQSLQSGIIVSFKASAANTDAVTLNLDSLGAKKVRKQGDSALSANDILANGTYLTRYDEAYDGAVGAWVLMNPSVSTSTLLTDPAITGTITEDIFTITDGASFEIDPGNGSIQLVTLGANRTPLATNFAAGESVTLMVADGTARTITWTSVGVTWVGGSAPTLATSGYTVIELWKVASTIYGAHVGDVA